MNRACRINNSLHRWKRQRMIQDWQLKLGQWFKSLLRKEDNRNLCKYKQINFKMNVWFINEFIEVKLQIYCKKEGNLSVETKVIWA